MSVVDELDGDGLQAALRDETRGVFVDFWSPWCGPCRILRPHLHAMAEERLADWRFVAVNTEAHPDVAEEFDVVSLPTLALFRNGEELDRLTGGVTLSSVVGKLDQFSEARL